MLDIFLSSLQKELSKFKNSLCSKSFHLTNIIISCTVGYYFGGNRKTFSNFYNLQNAYYASLGHNSTMHFMENLAFFVIGAYPIEFLHGSLFMFCLFLISPIFTFMYACENTRGMSGTVYAVYGASFADLFLTSPFQHPINFIVNITLVSTQICGQITAYFILGGLDPKKVYCNSCHLSGFVIGLIIMLFRHTFFSNFSTFRKLIVFTIACALLTIQITIPQIAIKNVCSQLVT